MAEGILSQDRRRRLRFPLKTELTYHVLGRGYGNPRRGTGEVVNISSRGLAFHTDDPLEPGSHLRVLMSWPAKLDNKTMLRLVFEGVVLRTRGNLVVTNIAHPELRTAGKDNAAAREEIAAVTSGIQTLLVPKDSARA
jgi:hypothetical protein